MSKGKSVMERAMVVVLKGEERSKAGRKVREANARLVSAEWVKRTNAAISDRRKMSAAIG